MTYKVGEIYKELIAKNEAIVAHLSSKDGLRLSFLWKNPTEHIIKALENKPFFQLYFKNELMFLLIKFDELKWLDVPLIFNENTKNLFFCEDEYLPVKILLVNSNTGKVYVNKQNIMPKGLTKAFIQGIHLQKDMSKKVILEKINNVRASFSASDMSKLSLGKIT